MKSESLVLMVKGPSHLGKSFTERLGVLRFIPSSQTLCPGVNGWKFLRFCLARIDLDNSSAPCASLHLVCNKVSLSFATGGASLLRLISGIVISSYL